jgi:hypothetical protein
MVFDGFIPLAAFAIIGSEEPGHQGNKCYPDKIARLRGAFRHPTLPATPHPQASALPFVCGGR